MLNLKMKMHSYLDQDEVRQFSRLSKMLIDNYQNDVNLQPVKPVTYSVIKSGLIGLTKYLASYWCDAGVRCNALSPGGVYLNQGQNFVNRLERLIPMGRMASADEYKSTVQYMCSEASSYMNGQNIILDGGRSAW